MNLTRPTNHTSFARKYQLENDLINLFNCLIRLCNCPVSRGEFIRWVKQLEPVNAWFPQIAMKRQTRQVGQAVYEMKGEPEKNQMSLNSYHFDIISNAVEEQFMSLLYKRNTIWLYQKHIKTGQQLGEHAMLDRPFLHQSRQNHEARSHMQSFISSYSSVGRCMHCLSGIRISVVLLLDFIFQNIFDSN